ncbi:MAG: CRISPR system precrRNA processing endoribonuclease RAMP protein Cas6 [Anaerolineales bacterium]|nr:CRISPR system precrRNA processing endoribonuclease RAMP protein Cas6 [Anaerolineales bacterium]
MTPKLTFTHLRFDAIASSDIHLGGCYAGSNLRNALAGVMLQATCPQTQRRAKPTPEHAAVCPACWLLAAEVDPGSVVRAYAVIPPIPAPQTIPAGEAFAFGLTLFGDGFQFLPYFVLAVGEVGRVGVGRGRHEGYGRFSLQSIHAIDPLQGHAQQLLHPGENLVSVPDLHVDWQPVPALARQLNAQIENSGQLIIKFHTPLRLVENKQLFKVPDFAVLFRRLLYRIDDLGRQCAGQERRERAEIATFNQLADQVRLVESQTQWHEIWSWSGRKQNKTPHGGLVGTAIYWAADWQPLLPWLIFGQGTQVGKSAVRGNGIYSIVNGKNPGYFDWLL